MVLPDDFSLPDQLRQIFCGELPRGMDFILQFNEIKNGLIKEVFPNIDDEYDKVWQLIGKLTKRRMTLKVV